MYILTPATHNKSMENNKTNAAKKNKKNSAFKKIGKSIKDAFIEMSSSLAGWIDDAGNQFSGKKKSQTPAKKTSNSTQHKSSSSQTSK